MEINKKQTNKQGRKNRPRGCSWMPAHIRVLMQTQKWCEKKAPWKLSQEGCHQVPAGGVRQVRKGAKELSLPPILLSDLAGRNRQEAKCQRPAVPLPATALSHQYWVTHCWVPCPRPSRSLMPISNPKPFFIDSDNLWPRVVWHSSLFRC